MDVGARLIVDDHDAAPVVLARTYQQRRRGLLGTDGIDGALWIEPCKQVHTFRMRYAIDVAQVTRNGQVLTTRTLPPARLGPLRLRSRAVIEAEAGSFEKWGLRRGSRVGIRPAP